MTVFNTSRGAATLVKTGSDIISLSPALSDDNIIVSDVTISLAERATVISCFNQSNYIFAFGHNPEISQVSVTFSGFLTEDCNKDPQGSVIGKILGYYSDNRISNKKSLITLTAGSKAIEGALVGITVDGLSPELNMITATLTMLAVSSPGN